MKFLQLTFSFFASLLVLVACEQEPRSVIYTIVVDEEIGCSYDAQAIEISYRLTDHDTTPEDESMGNITAVCNADWVTAIDTSTHGKIVLDVTANDGDVRKAKLTISAVGHAKTSIEIVQLASPKGKVEHTLLFYFFGTSLDRYFRDNIADASEAIANGALGGYGRVIFFRQINRAKGYIGELCYNPEQNSCIERHIMDVSLATPAITPEIIAQNIALMAEQADADRYGLVLAGHGQGWITKEILNGDIASAQLSSTYNPWTQALGADVTRAFGESNVQVNISELATGIEQSGVDIDYILFDACFMANIEAVYELRNSANYIIASPCEIMGRGFPYHRTLPYLFANNGEASDLAGAAESYNRYYRSEYVGSSRCGSVALFDCSEVEALVDATRDVVASAKEEYEIDAIQTYEGHAVHIFYDLGHWATTVATDQVALDAFHQQLERVIVAKYTLPTFYSAYGSHGTHEIDESVYSGVTTSAASLAYPTEWRKTSWYKAVWE